MLKKQDRQGVRTAADLERKYNLTKMMGASQSTHDFVLTEQDKQEIASIAISLLPIYNGEVIEE